MELDRPQLPRLDLQSKDVLRFDLFVTYRWTEQIAELFTPLLNGEAFYSRTTYSRQKRKYLVTATIRRFGDEEDENLIVNLVYDGTDRIESLQPRREAQRESEFLPRLLAVPDIRPIFCTMEFGFDTVDPEALWFPLPSRIGASGDAGEVFEIRGVRAVKLAAEDAGVNDWEYGFILDRPNGEAVKISVHFDLNRRFTLDVPAQALERGTEIARRLTGQPTPKRGTTS